MSVGRFPIQFSNSKPPSQLSHPLHFSTVHTKCLSASEHTLTHTAGDHWAFASFVLPERSDALWVVRVTYHSTKEPQLIVGIMEETQDSGKLDLIG